METHRAALQTRRRKADEHKENSMRREFGVKEFDTFYAYYAYSGTCTVH